MSETDFKSPLDMFYQWEQQTPDKTWLRQHDGVEWVNISWSQAGQTARALAAGMRELGLEDGDRVGLYAENSARWMLLDLAIMMAGLVSVPIYTSMPEDKIRYVVDHSGMKLLWVGDKCARSVEAVREGFPGIQVLGCGYGQGDEDWARLEQTKPLQGQPQRAHSNLWSISYTSGTTGEPKGVMHSFETLPFSAKELGFFAETGPDTRFFSYLPLAHIAERCVIDIHSYYAGAMVGFNRDKESFVADLLEIRPTFFFSVPRIWANLKAGIIAQLGKENWLRCIEEPEFGRATGEKILASMGLDQVTIALTGSAPIPPDDIRAWRCLGMPLCEGFGQSETMGGTFNPIEGFKIGSVGQMISPNSEMKISEEGELLLSSQGNMLGYYRNPEKTAETLVDGWIRTGDKGRIDEDGFLFITGRVKDIFKTAKGKYVAPAPVENRFGLLPGVEQCCLVGCGLPQTVMLTVLSEGVDAASMLESLQSQMEAVNAQLEVHERMSHVIVCAEAWTIENGLLTHTLKILRDDLEKRYQDLIENALAGDNSVVLEAASLAASA
jgi:long-chain acyl-CoA synthetase